MTLLIAFVSGIISATVVTALTIRILARHGVIDRPNQRSSHVRPVIRGGGIGLASGTLVALAIAHAHLVGSVGIALLAAGVGFGVIGLADDLAGGLRVSSRLGLQVVVAVGVAIEIMQNGSHGVLPVVLAGAAAAVWIIYFVNAFNFMDGIDGISCAETIVAGIAIGLVARHEHQPALETSALALVAGSIGFAPFNFPKARVFLGDVGSYFSGAWLAVLVAVGLRASIPVEALVAPVALYVADTGVTLVRRGLRHETLHEAHRQHTYQRLVDAGWSHPQTTGLVFVLVVLSSLLGSISLFAAPLGRAAADCGVIVLTVGYLTLPDLIERRHSVPRVGPHRITRPDQ